MQFCRISLEEELFAPVKYEKLASIIRNLFAKSLEDDKLKELVKKCNKPKKYQNIFAAKCNSETWRGNLNSGNRKNYTFFQKESVHTLKAAYSVTGACDKVLVKMGKLE